MIDYITGELTYIDADLLVIETGGIGYQIFNGQSLSFQQEKGQEMTVYTYQHVREDVLALYGFATREERHLFEKLLHVSGIGPKAAQAILAAGNPGQVISAIQMDDVAFLTSFPGVGKKTAQRIILDLKDKLDDVAARFTFGAGKLNESDVTNQHITQTTQEVSSALEESLEALQALGYAEKEVKAILARLKHQSEEDWDTEQYIKAGLQLLLK